MLIMPKKNPKTEPIRYKNGICTSASTQKTSVNTSKSPKMLTKKKLKPAFYSKEHKALDKILLDARQNIEANKLRQSFLENVSYPSAPKNIGRDVLVFPEAKLEPPLVERDEKPEDGLKIICHNKHKCIFANRKDLEHLEQGLGLKDPLCTFEVSLSQHPELLLEFLSRDLRPDGPFSDSFLLFLFRLMSVSEDHVIVLSCRDFLLHALQANLYCNHKWAPSLKDVIVVLLNYGCTKNKCPRFLSSSLLAAEKDLRKGLGEERRLDSTSKHPLLPKVLSLYNLGIVFELLSKAAGMGLYADEALARLVILLSWLLLDPQTFEIHLEIQACITALINAISEDGWNSRWLQQLGENLSGLSEKQEYVHSICTSLLSSGRSLILKKIVSYNAAHICLNAPYTFKPTIKILDVLNLVVCHPLTSLSDDVRSLQVLVSHIDRVVGNDINVTDTDHLIKLSQLVKSSTTRMVDSIHSLDATHVKSLLVTLYCKWSFMTQQLTSQRDTSWKYQTMEVEGFTPGTPTSSPGKLESSLTTDVPRTPSRRRFPFSSRLSLSPVSSNCDSLNDSLPSPEKIPYSPPPPPPRNSGRKKDDPDCSPTLITHALRNRQVKEQKNPPKRPCPKRKQLGSPGRDNFGGVDCSNIPSYYTTSAKQSWHSSAEPAKFQNHETSKVMFHSYTYRAF